MSTFDMNHIVDEALDPKIDVYAIYLRKSRADMEAEKLGMNTIIIPKNNLKGIDTSRFKIKIVEVSKVEEAFRVLFS